MCNRAERGATDKVLNLFGARLGARVNEGPLQVHPKEPGSVIRLIEGEAVLERKTGERCGAAIAFDAVFGEG